jgi:RHS repeat-associated protein
MINHHKTELIQADDYYPFGLTFNSYQRSYSKSNNYKYQGKEEVPEMGVGTYDFHARMYDATLVRTFQMDPMAEKFYGYSPYSWVMNNPLIMIDPTGMVAAPIYDTEGNFLGTDDEGLQGAGIVMEKENFSQGMSHAEAKKKNLGAEGLKDEEALEKVGRHYSELPSRPDYDGVLTFKEVTKWSNQGSGEPLFVDGSKINLDNTSVEDVKDAQKNNNGYIDYFIKGGKNEIGVIYGNIKLTLENENTGDVKLGKNGLLDIHDFKNPAFKTINDMLYPGKPKDFKIYCAPCDNKVKTN